jgi:hypothetical protein
VRQHARPLHRSGLKPLLLCRWGFSSALSVKKCALQFRYMFKSFFAALAIVWVSFFGGHHTSAVMNQPAAVVAAAPTNQTSPISAAGTSASAPSALPAPQLFFTTALPSGQPKNISAAEYANTAAAGLVLGTSTQTTYVTQEELTAQLQQATNALRSVIYQNESAPNSLPASGGYTNDIAIAVHAHDSCAASHQCRIVCIRFQMGRGLPIASSL